MLLLISPLRRPSLGSLAVYAALAILVFALVAMREVSGAETETIPSSQVGNATSARDDSAELPESAADESGEGLATALTLAADPLEWWSGEVSRTMLNHPRWVEFDLPTVLLDTLEHSPLIQSVSARTSVAMERTVQQDAAFDPAMLFNTRYGRTNDPVGNTLTTGGPPRLNESSFTNSAAITKNNRSGSTVDLTQSLNWNDSNSLFFTPNDQINSRLSLSLTQPLYAGRGQLYGERLLTQARIDSSIAWQEMRVTVEERLAAVMTTYWKLYEARCHLVQQQALIERGKQLEAIILARDKYDAGPVDIAKIRQRLARRNDRRIEVAAEVLQHQSRLAALTGSEALMTYDASVTGSASGIEMIPLDVGSPPDVELSLRDAVISGIENRSEVKAAASELEAAALDIQVTRNQLLPQLDAVVEAYVAGLRGDGRVGQAFLGQFGDSGPGVGAGFQYDLPAGRRFAKSRHREANYRYRQVSEELRETILQTRQEIESALISLERTAKQRQSKRLLLETAIVEEEILTRRWELFATDNSGLGLVLETLLDAQQRRSDAEREWVISQTEYRLALVQLERAMGTLLIAEGIQPERVPGSNDLLFVETSRTVPAPEKEALSPSNVEVRSEPSIEPLIRQTPSVPLVPAEPLDRLENRLPAAEPELIE